MCLMHRVCGRAQASTDGGRRAPFELGEDVEREARPLCIEGSAAAEQHAAGVARGEV